MKTYEGALNFDTNSYELEDGRTINREEGSIHADWKVEPTQLMEEVNRVLADRGVLFRFAVIDEGSDQYHFFTEDIK